MIKDPRTVWAGSFPYDVLAPAGITPNSTQAEVEDASFTLMRKGLMNPAAQRAWNELRDPARRMVVDLLLYDVDLDGEIAEALDRVRRMMADPDEPPGVADAVTVPAEFADGLAEELTDLNLAPPRAIDTARELGRMPELAPMRRLIRFDR